MAEPSTLPLWRGLAADALHAATAADWATAGTCVRVLAEQYGPETIPEALLVWIGDMLTQTGQGTYGPTCLEFCNADTGLREVADEVPAPARWAGRLAAACKADDFGMVCALFDAVETDKQWCECVYAVLSMCGQTIQALGGRDD